MKILISIIFFTLTWANAGSLSKDKRYGVEINPFYLLVANNEDERWLSGTITYFNHQQLYEVAMPLHYMSSNNYKQQTFDIHLRKYINPTIKGLYFSGFTRLAHLEGTSGNEYIKQLKIGFGAGVGFRLFHKSGFYWGASLSLGGYPFGESDIFTHQMFQITDDPKLIIDIELLKFGYAF